MKCVNGLVGITPFKRGLTVKVDSKSGLAGVEQKTTMIEVEVVIPSDKIPLGTAYIRGEAVKAEWAALVHKVDDVEFVLCPETMFCVTAEGY